MRILIAFIAAFLVVAQPRGQLTVNDYTSAHPLNDNDLLYIGNYVSSGVFSNGKVTAAQLRTYVTNGIVGLGTVTSVSLTAPDIFTVSGSGGTTAVSLVVAPTDPNADRIVFWDDSAGKWVYLAPGSGLLITGTSLAVDISGLTADGSPDGAADYVMTYDASAGALKKVLLNNLPGSGGGSVATDTIWDAKGDLAVGTGANTASRLAIGADNTIPIADSAEATGIRWGAVTGFESTLEGVLDLQDLQGAVTDAQVPNNITIDLATLASTVTVVDGSDSTSFPLIADSATGNLAVKTDTALTYDATTGILGATGFSSSGASAGSLDLGDSDGSHFFSIRPNGTTTTSVSFLGPAAPFAGYVQFTVSGTTNWIPSQVAFGNGLLGSDGSNNPVDVDTEAELETALGSVDVVTVTTDDITSANLRTALSDESGTGAAIFAGGNIGAATATTPAGGDNDTSVATTAYVQTELAALGAISDTAFGVAWNGVTTDASSQNALHDWGVIFDTDYDGKVNVLDLTAGIVKTDGSGVVSVATANTDYEPALTDSASLRSTLSDESGTGVAIFQGSSYLDGAIGITIDGGGSAITTGIKGFIEIPFACTITRVTMLADQSGSAVVDIWKDTYANYPPTDADSITASAVPTISTATKSQDSTLTGWTTSVSAGDIIGFNVDSASTITRLTITLKTTR